MASPRAPTQAEARRFQRGLIALPELELRIQWLEQQLLQLDTPDAARVLNQLCEDGERRTAVGRETLVVVALLFAGMPNPAWVEALRDQAAAQHLLSLDRLLRRGPRPAMLVRNAEDQAVPNYGAGRELTVGERKSLARRPSRAAFDKLLGDPHPQVIAQLLRNPRLTERDVVRLVTRRPLPPDVAELVARSPRWVAREHVRRSLLFNPGTPPEISVPLLGLCTRQELRELLQHSETCSVVRQTALEHLERRPPLANADREPLVQ